MIRLAILVLFVASALAVPLRPSDDRCAATCTESSKFDYDVGMTYEYTYRSEIRTTINGTTPDESGILVVANVQMEILSKCEFSMRLSDVIMSDMSPMDTSVKDTFGQEFKTHMEKNPTRFAFQDGLVEALCISGEEPSWVLNVKRAILSVFQNTMENLKQNHTTSESDVAGECVTHYSPHQETSWLHPSAPITITKRKELSTCTGRHGYNSAVQGIPYSAQSEYQALPILRSSLECQHKVDSRSGYLLSAECHEAHLFRPFSTETTGAVTISNQYLNFVKISRGTKSPVSAAVKKTINFEHQIDTKTLESNRKDITRRLQEFCETSQNGVTPETPHQFTELVYRMRTLDLNTISDIYRLLNDGAFCKANKDRTRKFFLDALPMAGTAASLSLMTDLITKKIITGTEADMWITSLTFIKYPTQDMLKEVKPLINMEEIADKALLSVGNLVHTYCSNHGNCDRDSMVRAIVSAFENKLARGCKVNKDNIKTTLYALRGLGNIGYIERAMSSIDQCYKSANNPINVRLSAINAYRRAPCGGDRKQLVKLFTDIDEDSEVRIAAYRALMQCPAEGILKLVTSTLNREPVKQVGSYIWSHLTNLRETSDPHLQELRAELEKLSLNSEFDLDKMKYSRNYEGSLFLEKINTGAKLEGDAIWSTKSFIPRSGMLNLTVDLFGHSVNLLEIGSRVEGLEYFLEKFFGPKGYFGNPSETPQTSEIALKNGDKTLLDKVNRYEAKMAELRGSMYIRVFGNEMRYMNFDGMDELLSGGSNFNFLDMMIQLSKENDYSYSHSTMFLDSSFIIPTGAGFPLNLTVNGTATVDLRLQGKMDLSNPPSVDIIGHIQPSAAISVSSTMSVDAYLTKTGVKMESTLHTNTAFNAKINVNEAGIVHAEYNMPQEKMTVIGFKSSFFNTHNNVETEQRLEPDTGRDQVFCTPHSLTTILGVEMCAELEQAGPMSKTRPFPVKGGVFIYNRDTHTKYILKASSIHTKAENIVKFEVDTPGSRVDRRVAMDLSLNRETMNLGMSLQSPWKQAEAKGKILDTKPLRSVSGEFSLDGKKQFDFNAQLAFRREGNAYKYSPSLEINQPNFEPINIRAMLIYNELKQLEVEMAVSGITTDPQSAKATFINRPNMVSLHGELSLQKGKVYSFTTKTNVLSDSKVLSINPMVSIRNPEKELLAFGGTLKYLNGKKLEFKVELDKIVSKKMQAKGTIVQIVKKKNRILHRIKYEMDTPMLSSRMLLKMDNRGYKRFAADLDLSFVVPKVIRDSVKVAYKITNLSSSSLTKALTSLDVNFKRRSQLNTKMIANIEHNKKLTKLDVDLKYGPDFKDATKKIDLEFTLDKKIKSLTEAIVQVESRLAIPALDILSTIKGEHKHTTKELDSTLEVRFGKTHKIKSILRLRDETKQMLKLSGEYNLDFLGKEMVFNHTLEQKTDTMYLSSINTQLEKGKKNSILTTYGTRGGKSRYFVTTDFMLQAVPPFKLEGELDLDPADFIARTAYEKKDIKYEATLESTTTSSLTNFKIGLIHPERNVQLDMEIQSKNKGYIIDSDLKWDAKRDNSKSVKFNAWMEMSSVSNVNGSFTLKYPSRTINLNAQSLLGPKSNLHIDVNWEKDQSVAADFSSEITGKRFLSSASLTTPFECLPRITADLKHIDNKDEYMTDFSASWMKDESMSLGLILKKPFDFRTFVGSVDLTTSLKSVKNARFEVDHKLSIPLASLTTFFKVLFNRETIKVDLHLQNKTKGQKVAFEGSMDIQTTFSVLKKGEIRLLHKNDGKTFETSASALRNRQQYSFDKKISLGTKTNTGSITVKLPRETYDTDWSVELSSDSVRSSLSTSWGRKGQNTILMKLFGQTKDSITGSLTLETPFDGLKTASIEMLMRKGEMDFESQIIAQSNNEKHIFGKITANKWQTGVKGSAAIKIPVLNVDLSLAGNVSNPPQRLESQLELSLLSHHFSYANHLLSNEDGFSSDTTLTSSVPGYERIILTSRIGADNFNSRLTYGQDKAIELSSRMMLDTSEKLFTILLTTPFSNLSRFETEIASSGSLDNINIAAFLEILPKHPKSTVSVNWAATMDKLELGFKLDRLNGQPVDINLYTKANKINKTESQEVSFILKGKYSEDKKLHIEITKTPELAVIKVNSPVVSLNIQNTLTTNAFTNTASVTISEKTYSIETSFNSLRQITGHVTINVPSRRPIQAQFSHKGSLADFETHAEVMHNRKNSFNFYVKSSIKTELSASLKTSLTTEILPFVDNNFEADLSFNGKLSKFDSRAKFVSQETGTTEIATIFDATSDIDGSFEFRSRDAKNIKASFNHHFKNSYWLCKSQLTRGGADVFNVLASVDAENFFRGEINLKTMWTEDMRVAATADGKLINFNFNTQGSYGSNEATLVVTSQTEASFSKQTLSIKATDMKDIYSEISHTGLLTNFQALAQLKIGGEKHMINGRFMKGLDIEGSLSLSSPFTVPVSISFNHAGNLKNFKSQGQLNIDSNTTDVSANFMMSPSIEGTLTLTSPYGVEFTGQVRLTPKKPSITSSAFLSINKITVLDLKTSFTNDSQKILGSISLKSAYLTSVDASVHHMGPVTNMQNHAEITIGSQPATSIDVNLQTADKLMALLSVENIQGIPNTKVTFEHSGQISNFVTSGEVIITMDEPLVTKAMIRATILQAIDTSISFEAPFIQPVSINFRHEGGLKKFTTRADIEVDREKSEVEISSEMISSGVITSISIKSPYNEDISGMFRASGPQNSLTAQGEVLVGGRVNKVTAIINQAGNTYSSQFTVISPHTGNILINFRHDGDVSNFTTHGDLTCGQSFSEFDVSLNVPSKHALFSVKTPEISTTVEHSGDVRNFATMLEFKNLTKVYSAEVKLTTNKFIEASMKLQSPVQGYQTISALYTHAGNPRNFQCHGELEIENAKSTADLNVNIIQLDNVKISLEAQTPKTEIKGKIEQSFDQQSYQAKSELTKDGSSLFILNADWRKQEAKLELKVDSQTHYLLHATTDTSIQNQQTAKGTIKLGSTDNQASVSFVQKPKMIGFEMAVNSDYSDFTPTIKSELNIEGTLMKYSGNAEIRVGQNSLLIKHDLDVLDKVETSLNVDIKSEFYHRVSVLNFKQSALESEIRASMLSNEEELINVLALFNHSDKVTASLSLTSSISHPLSVKADGSGSSWTNFQASTTVTHKSQTIISSEGSFAFAPSPLKLAARFRFNELLVDASLDKSDSVFKSNTEFKLAKKIWSSHISFENSFPQTMTSTLSLRYPNSEPIKGSISYKKQSAKTQATLAFALTSAKRYSVDLELTTREKTEGKIYLSTPIDVLKSVELTFDHQGSFPNIKSNAELSYNSNKQFLMSVNLQHNENTNGKITFSSPIDGLETIDVSFYKNGPLSMLKTGGRVQYAVGEEVSFEFDHMYSDKSLMAKAQIMSPFTDDIILSFNNSKSPNSLESSMELSMGDDNKLLADIDMKSGYNFFSLSSNGEALMAGEPFTTKFSLHHEGSIDNFKTSASAEAMTKKIEVTADFKLLPVISGALEIKTPFQNFTKTSLSFTHTGNSNGFLATGELNYGMRQTISGKVDVMNNGLKRTVVTAEIKTPFTGYEFSRLSYQHFGDRGTFQCNTVINFMSNQASAMIKGSKKPLSIGMTLNTPFEGLENVGLNGELHNMNQDIQTQGQIYWGNDKSATFEVSFLPSPNKIEASARITTPFTIIPAASVGFTHQKTGNAYLESLKVSYKTSIILDMDLDSSLLEANKPLRAAVNIRKPVSVKVEGEGLFSYRKANTKLSLSSEGDAISSGTLEAGYDLNEREINFLFKSDKTISLKGFARNGQSQGLLTWGPGPQNQISYEVDYRQDSNLRIKAIVLERSVLLEVAKRQGSLEGMMAWDADRDITKKINFNIQTRTGLYRSTLTFPSLSRTFVMESELVMNRGKVLIGGKTELSLSTDPSKKFIISSQLKDESIGGLKNYSFNFEMSQPFTTLGVKVGSYFGHMGSSCSAGVALEYLTSQRRMETFKISGDIDRLRKTMNLQLQSPIKSIRISGNSRTDEGYQLNLVNVYDNQQPIKTQFSVSPVTRTISFIINYDLANPSNELHISAGYVNSSAMKAEVFRMVNGFKVTDALLTLRLNTSRLLHSRLHWRPEMFSDIQEYQEKKSRDYSNRINRAIENMLDALTKEITHKRILMVQVLSDLIGQDLANQIISNITKNLNLYSWRDMLANTPKYDRFVSAMNKVAQQTQFDMHYVNKMNSEELIQAIQPLFNQARDYALMPRKMINERLPSAINFEGLLSENMYSKLQSVDAKLEISNQTLEMINSLLLSAEAEIRQQLTDLETKVVNVLHSQITVFDPKNGEIQIELHSPVPLISLDVVPAIDVTHYTEKVMAYLKSLETPEKPAEPIKNDEWLPPYTGIASIEKGYKITTFDGYMYDLEEGCSYLLAKDFIDQNFTLVLSNNDATMLSLHIGTTTLEITLGEEVLINGQPLLESYKDKDMAVDLSDENVAIELPEKHVSIDYNMGIDHITIKLNGWYFGKTAGLLGTYDNEPSNDLMTPYNKVIDNTSRFAKLWRVSNC